MIDEIQAFARTATTNMAASWLTEAARAYAIYETQDTYKDLCEAAVLFTRAVEKERAS